MKIRHVILLVIISCVLTIFDSCVDFVPTHEVHVVDSLNAISYKLRYVNIQVSANAAFMAYRRSHLYKRGKAEACNNMAFCFYLRMNFEKAEQLYKKVSSITDDEIELLVADVGLMRIYQRTAMNQAFYEYRNNAKRRMKRIDEDSCRVVIPHDIVRLNYAYSEYSIVSAVYYYYLQQQDQALSAINSLDMDKIKDDLSQSLYYNYIKGATSLCSGQTREGQKLNCFDQLFNVWRMASQKNILYLEANSLQSIANLLSTDDAFQFFKQRRSYALSQIMPVDSLFPLSIGNRSLALFGKFKDPYQISNSYITIARYYNMHNDYKTAFNILCKALYDVNEYHRLYYHPSNFTDRLKPYMPNDTINRELQWISNERTKTVPECLLSIREQLSVSYAGMGNKIASDYNRNVYLDILNYTRQDRELENRYNVLQKQLSNLNITFIITLILVFLVIFLLWWFNKFAKKRDRLHALRLQKILDECRSITAYSSDEAIEQRDKLKQKQLDNKNDRLMGKIFMPYLLWVIDNRKTILLLSEKYNQLSKEHYISQQHVVEDKRENIIKKTFLSIVNSIDPYIGRVVNEVSKLQSSNFNESEHVRQERFNYIDELITIINDYNNILTLWIKIKQGSLNLNIQSFQLKELFALIEKGRRTFELKHLDFIVEKTQVYVRADKALTLFMINTLADNARKYTLPGGKVRISAKPCEQYVEISVEDTGVGLSAEDVQCILGDKIYDSSRIGLSQNNIKNTLLVNNKGNGFGLMNCKGIIETYRKTSPIFKDCIFSVESTLGKGSRFFFRIPYGIKKTFIMLFCILLPFVFQSCRHENEMKERDIAIDSIAKIEKKPGFEDLLNKASYYADLTYYSNVDHQYNQAITYADSAISYLNAHYRKYARHPRYFMKLTGDGTPAEIQWWYGMYDSDFHVILDVRNESAVAFLALKQWGNYKYNNDAYTTLYKLLGEDRMLGEYCRHLQRSTTDKTVELGLCFLFIVIAIGGYYFFYVRRRIVHRLNLEQVLVINKTIFNASLQDVKKEELNLDSSENEENILFKIPRNIVNETFDAMNELIPINCIGLAIYNSNTSKLAFVSSPSIDKVSDIVQRCFDLQVPLRETEKEVFPLIVSSTDEPRCVGVLYLEIRQGIRLEEEDRLLIRICAEYIAIVVLNSILNLAFNYRSIESIKEEINKSRYEEGLLHVQNMVLDNCLSIIKHETVYYPNKIKQIISQLRKVKGNKQQENDGIKAISELIEYYRGIYTILSSCARRQVEDVTFRRSVIFVSQLTDYALKYFNGRNIKNDKLFLQVFPIEGEVVGDIILLHFMIENLINQALKVNNAVGKLLLRAYDDNDFIRFDFIDTRNTLYTQEDLNKMFYPQQDNMEYLVCKQIIREHDEYSGHRGCRINAEIVPEGGFSVYFTILKKK